LRGNKGKGWPKFEVGCARILVMPSAPHVSKGILRKRDVQERRDIPEYALEDLPRDVQDIDREADQRDAHGLGALIIQFHTY
jgi:hypothetical protein